ncbi:MAG TPA: phenylalanine--tRNA ligase subunit beta [Alphaproteobacteria bacterium]|nr:phenylalanine--tRNA ligase subunit beta [Alphaproteobacteria bacterium]
MKISLDWLADYITLKAGLTPQQLADGLVQLGHEVDAIHDGGKAFNNVVIGHILSREQHPNADRLGVCMVDVGEKNPRQIVCGAPNARAGLTVAVALPGAVLPGDFKIADSSIRGVESRGMICAEDELGLGSDHAGIMELETKAKPGTPFAQATGRADIVLEVAVTPNRGDCLSHHGLARDMAALGLGKLKALPKPKAGKGAVSIKVATQTAGCPQFNIVQLKSVKNAASPAHVQARLMACGLRPRNAVVDATNYVMLALGQPLHAYDAAKVKGSLTAREANGGEKFEGIGDRELTLQKGDVVIADDSGIVGLGGILGGTSTAVSDATTDVLLEAAVFDRVSISLTGQAHQLVTDARQRFERGIDPALTQAALLACAELIADWTGADASAMATAGKGVPAPKAITYSPAFFAQFVGLEVAAAEQKKILTALGFSATGTGASLKVVPPAFRTHMENPEDIVEEILRVVGYENVPPQLPPASPAQVAINGSAVTLDRKARRALAAAGCLEIITYSFIGRDTAGQFAEGESLIQLSNPLAETDMTTLRPSLLPGLLKALQGNLSRHESTPLLGEVGKVFTARGERLNAAVLMAGVGAKQWQHNAPKPDVFAAKGLGVALLEQLDAPVGSLQTGKGAGAVYHPGRSGTLSVGPFGLMRFGELHPGILKAYDITVPVAVLELELEPLLKMKNKAGTWQPMPYPPVLRDLAFVLPAATPAAAVAATIAGSSKELIRDVSIFDLYQGDKIEAGKKSLALALTLQSPERTLTEADITAVLKAAVEAVQQKHEGQLRA